jgi:HEAT repeat protein
MLRLDRFASCRCLLLVLAAVAFTGTAQADIAGLGADGWHTWQVEAANDAPEMCCFSWKSRSDTKRQCDLDGRNGGFNSSDNSSSSDDGVQVYTLIEAGTVNRIRVFSSSCPVVADSEIIDLGRIETNDSVDWLEPLVVGGDVTSDAITAIAVHEGAAARNVLLNAAKAGNEEDIREDAIFWMAQVRVNETEDDIKRYIFDDTSPDIREHAAFAYSQSQAKDIADTLIRQGRYDREPDVRSHAWFWLAQTEAAESETAIRGALLNDEDDDVREEAVFALSQLPEGRAVTALAAILEDKSLEMNIREQALFWLAQTESDEAFEYIDRLLSDN